MDIADAAAEVTERTSRLPLPRRPNALEHLELSGAIY
jgi:hypothetical protein